MHAIDLIKIPFSTRGAFSVFSIMKYQDDRALYYRDIRGGDLDPGLLFRFAFYDTQTQAPIDIEAIEVCASPSALELSYAAQKCVSITYENEDTVRIRTHQGVVKTSMLPVEHKYDTLAQIGNAHWEFSSYFKEIKIGIQCLNGKGNLSHEWTGIGNKNIVIELGENSEWRFTTYVVTESKSQSRMDAFEVCVDRRCSAFEAWRSHYTHDLPNVIQHYDDFSSVELEPHVTSAAHILWQNFVKPLGQLKYEALYMTKNWMTNIWSWDNYFSAMGLYKASPKAAYEQLVMFESLQDDSGAFPDYANDRYASYSCNKPPLLGWCYEWLMARDVYFRDQERMNRILVMAERQVAYWFTHRMSDFGLPYYTHGNDSGWDNGTFFSEGVPVITPDLSTFLLLQLEFLMKHHPSAVKKAKFKSLFSALLDDMIVNLWDGHQFVSIKLPEGRAFKREGTLQRLMPLLIANHLPESVKHQLKADLATFETPYGFSTERHDSAFYKYDGYWRGPIWAPTTYLFINALQRVHEDEWAKRISEKFIKLVMTGGFAENFDPFSGEGLVDTGFAWTASVFAAILSSQTP